MKNPLRRFVVLLLCVSVSGCGLLCQAGTGTCGMSSEQAERLLHPKAYGEYWVKPGMTKENWRQDWVICGGYKDGSFSPTIREINALAEHGLSRSEARANLEKSLESCMQTKGYEYRKEP